MTTEYQPDTPEHFRAAKTARLLTEWNIPLDTWGTGSAKTLNHFVKELEEGESQLEVRTNEAGERHLVRSTRVAALDVYYTDEATGTQYRLVEEKQVFKDGRTRERPHMSTSLGEKLKTDEDVDEAALRAVEEELGFMPEQVLPRGDEVVVRESHSYPGLQAELSFYYYDCEISPKDYRPEGYIEQQADKDVYFVWQPISQ